MGEMVAPRYVNESSGADERTLRRGPCVLRSAAIHNKEGGWSSSSYGP